MVRSLVPTFLSIATTRMILIFIPYDLGRQESAERGIAKRVSWLGGYCLLVSSDEGRERPGIQNPEVRCNVGVMLIPSSPCRIVVSPVLELRNLATAELGIQFSSSSPFILIILIIRYHGLSKRLAKSSDGEGSHQKERRAPPTPPAQPSWKASLLAMTQRHPDCGPQQSWPGLVPFLGILPPGYVKRLFWASLGWPLFPFPSHFSATRLTSSPLFSLFISRSCPPSSLSPPCSSPFFV